MLWFYESFFPVVWIFFLLYWQIKAANTKSTQRLEPAAVVRHPIYTGILTGFLGMAIAISQVRGFIVFVLIFLAFWIKLRMEEQWMRSQFGETYATYAHQTAALVPYLF